MFIGRLKRVIVLLTLLLFPVLILTPVETTQAASDLDYSLLGTHPQAQAETTADARTLYDLEYFNGKLYAGYGDYTANTGPTSINPFNLSIGTFTGSELSVATEAIRNLKIINNKIYALTVDPTCAFTCTAGYAIGEPWENKTPLQAAHLYDIATFDGNDLWIAGSTEQPGQATLWRSTDGGDTWQVEQTDENETPNEFERYFWVAKLGDKLYTQANSVYPAPVRIFDGENWTTGTTEQIVNNEGRSIVFNNKLVSTWGGLSVFDGTSKTAITSLPDSSTQDFYVADGYLYVLRGSGRLARTTDLESWQELGTTVDGASSIAVHDGTVYIGTSSSQLYKSNSSMPTTLPTVSITAPNDGAEVQGEVVISVEIESENPIVQVTFKRNDDVLHTYNDDTTTHDWDTTNKTNQSVDLTVEVIDEMGNVAVSEVHSVTVNNPVGPGEIEHWSELTLEERLDLYHELFAAIATSKRHNN